MPLQSDTINGQAGRYFPMRNVRFAEPDHFNTYDPIELHGPTLYLDFTV